MMQETVSNMDTSITVFAILNWGLGHATRCIPLIRQFQSLNKKILIVSEGQALALLKKECPELDFYDTGFKSLKYSKSKFLLMHLLKLVPQFLKHTRQERLIAQQICQSYKVETIFSDNRYGFHCPSVKNVFLTHQIRPFLPFPFKIFSRLIYKKIASWINRFDECLIFDNQDAFYAGSLSSSKSLSIPCRYIGISSRLEQQQQNQTKNIDFLAIISGLEPHRTQFESILRDLQQEMDCRIVIVTGQAQGTDSEEKDIIALSDSNQLQNLIAQSRCVISRSGYSSIMDYYTINQRAILVPTPGQSEQEYLARRHQNADLFQVAESSKSSIKKAIQLFLNSSV